MCARRWRVTPFMPSEKERGILSDILRHIDLAEHFARGLDYDGLNHNLQALYAVIRSLEIISEASRRLSDKLKARHPDIPWRDCQLPAILSTQLRRCDRATRVENLAGGFAAPATGYC